MGDIAGAVEALRWAMIRGEPRVVLADALAEAIHTIARVGPMSGDPYRLAAELGMPPWRVQKAQRQARGWSTESVAAAMRLVATLNADVKGAAADADYVLEADYPTGRGTGGAARAPLTQSLFSVSASEDFRLAAWFLWMTPLLAALSRLAAGRLRQLGGLVLVSALGSLMERADRRVKRRFHRLVAQPAALVGAIALHLRLDVGHA